MIFSEGIAVCECSDNLEIFRLRLGKCLNFEYAEDYIGGLFSRRDPREGGPLVDIEVLSFSTLTNLRLLEQFALSQIMCKLTDSFLCHFALSEIFENQRALNKLEKVSVFFPGDSYSSL
jgi:hypothetical protein